jgi:hypothetical protein
MKLLGIEVRDATKPVLLRIRPADTKTGKKDPEACAAAKAAKRLRGVLEARIYRTRSYLLHRNSKGPGKHWKRYITPASIRTEIVSFDRGAEFDPGDYRLRPIGNSGKLGSYKKHKETGTGKKHGRRSLPHIVRGIREQGPKGRGKHG